MVSDVKKRISELLEQLDAAPAPHGKVGIGITEHNRPDMFRRCLAEVEKYAPQGAEIVVVDDASDMPVPGATYRFEKNVGIAVAKNMCLSLLYQRGCEHIFLLDSDTWPRTSDAWTPYINSKEPHLMYIFEGFKGSGATGDTLKVYEDGDKVAYSHPRGCMLYYHRSVLDAVGGMDPVFGKWGYEHPSHSDRIYNAGLTSFRYQDVPGSGELWYSDDEENRNVNTTVRGVERQEAISRNLQLYLARRDSAEFIPFLHRRNILLTCYFAGVNDPQRGSAYGTTSEALQPLIRSLKDTKLVVLHDCLSDADTDKVEFVRVPTSINPYFQRWVSYRRYLMDNAETIGNVFCIDGTDVEQLREPDWEGLGDLIHVGDEPEMVDDRAGWMRKHHPAIKIQEFLDIYGKRVQMLNAGIVGGRVEVVCDFIRRLLDFWATLEDDAFKMRSPNAGTTDMGAFNYVARMMFGDRIRSGRHVCTTFKAEERNDYSWFKHK